MHAKKQFRRRPRRLDRECGSMLIELLIAMVVLAVGLGGILVLLVASIYTNNTAGKDTTSTMVAEHVLEQISAQPANAVSALTLTDCAGTGWSINTVGAGQGAGSGGSYGGDGANLTTTGIIDWTQTYASVPPNYAMRYAACGAGGKQTVYDIRWDILTMSTFSRMIVVSARPSGSAVVGGVRYIIPPNMRTIGGM